jgi:hypothetical protein
MQKIVTQKLIVKKIGSSKFHGIYLRQNFAEVLLARYITPGYAVKKAINLYAKQFECEVEVIK